MYQFIAKHTNHREDDWGGDYDNRMRMPVEIVRRVREKVGENFIIMYRLSMLDLIENGSDWQEVVTLAKAIEAAGVTIINTGIGWHEARIPTIATMVPRAAFTWVTAKMRKELSVPLVTSNRINMPDVAEEVLARGDADMVSMARPFLADSEFVLKAEQNRADEINTCIGCNQACLDHTFEGKINTCLVNPRACHETELQYLPTKEKKKVAVVGAGPAGLAAATVAAQRGHDVTLYDANAEIGGQFNLAKLIPGKEEFYETLRYFQRQIELNKVNLKLNQRVTADELIKEGYDGVVVATGIKPRTPDIEGIKHPKVMGYIEAIHAAKAGKDLGKKVALIGAGGIGFDVAELVSHKGESTALNIPAFMEEWGVDMTLETRGGVAGIEAKHPVADKEIYLLQRKTTKVGGGLGKTTGWIHRVSLQKRGIKMINGCEYHKIDDAGLHLSIGGEPTTLDVDTVILCAGQDPLRELADQLEGKLPYFLIGGADVAAELDAKRAIDQGSRLAATL